MHKVVYSADSLVTVSNCHKAQCSFHIPHKPIIAYALLHFGSDWKVPLHAQHCP